MEEEDFAHLEKLVIGLSLPAAADILDSFHCRWRVVENNGEHAVVTTDYRLDRVNLRIKDNRVFEAYRG